MSRDYRMHGTEFEDYQLCDKCNKFILFKRDCYYAFSNGDYQDPVICLECISKIPV